MSLRPWAGAARKFAQSDAPQADRRVINASSSVRTSAAVGSEPMFWPTMRATSGSTINARSAGVSNACAAGAEVHYIEGNHDFLLTRVLAGIPRARVHSREFAVELDGKRFYIAHGDLVDPTDYSYRFLRAVFRSPLNRAFVKSIPGEWVDWIGTRSSRYSRGSRPMLPGGLPRERRDALRRVYRNFAVERIGKGFDFVILGHCHDDDEMSFQVEGRTGHYANVGYPRVHRNYLAWSAGQGEIQREPLPLY